MSAPVPVTVKLNTPIKNFKDTVTELVISREVNGGDLLEIDGALKYRATLILISRLFTTADGGKLSFDAVKNLGAQDIRALETALAPFMGIGATSEGDEDTAD